MIVEKKHKETNFKTLLLWSILLVCTVAIPVLHNCNRTAKKNSMMKRELVPDNEKLETFQELGFFGDIREDKWSNFLSAVQNNVSNSRKEPGNLSFSLYQPESGKRQPVWFERFENKQAHSHHKEQGYFKDAITVIQRSLKGKANSITLKEVQEIPASITALSDKPETTRHVIILFNVRPEKSQSFINAMAEVAFLSRKSKGNLEFNLYQYADEPNKFVLMEGWESSADHEAQSNQVYIKKLNAATEGFFVSNPMDMRWLVKDISSK